MRFVVFAAFYSLCVLAAGCGGDEVPERFQIQQTAAVGHANSMRSLIESLQHQLKTEGVNGLRSELATIDERLEEFSGDDIEAAQRTIYEKITPKLQDLARKVGDERPSKAELQELLTEIETLALDLPKADPPAAGTN